eukprot:15389587-Heterocapsa_arctica.AAC.1
MRASRPRRWTAPVAESNSKSQGCARACAAVASSGKGRDRSVAGPGSFGAAAEPGAERGRLRGSMGRREALPLGRGQGVAAAAVEAAGWRGAEGGEEGRTP